MAGNYKFANYLKNLRESREWTLVEVAAKCGISHASISRMENAKQDPENPDVLKKLAEVYEVSTQEMLQMAGYIEQANEEEKWPKLAEIVRDIMNSRGEEEKKELLNYAKYLYNKLNDKNRG